MTRSVAASLTLAAMLALAAGCTSFQRTTGVPLPGREVQVEFARPRALEVRLESGASATLENTRAVRGGALEIRGDTLFLRVSSWRGPGTWTSQAPPVVTLLPMRDPELTFGEERFSPEATLIGLVGVPVAVFALVVALYITRGPQGGT